MLSKSTRSERSAVEYRISPGRISPQPPWDGNPLRIEPPPTTGVDSRNGTKRFPSLWTPRIVPSEGALRSDDPPFSASAIRPHSLKSRFIVGIGFLRLLTAFSLAAAAPNRRYGCDNPGLQRAFPPTLREWPKKIMLAHVAPYPKLGGNAGPKCRLSLTPEAGEVAACRDIEGETVRPSSPSLSLSIR
jgi:hypothetical protein